MEADIVITISMVAGAVLIFNQFGRILRAYAMNKTLRQALTSERGITPELLDRLEENRPASNGDGRIGVVLVAIGAAIIVFGLITGDIENLEMVGIAVFPLFVGAALLGRIWYLRRQGAES